MKPVASPPIGWNILVWIALIIFIDPTGTLWPFWKSLSLEARIIGVLILTVLMLTHQGGEMIKGREKATANIKLVGCFATNEKIGSRPAFRAFVRFGNEPPGVEARNVIARVTFPPPVGQLYGCWAESPAPNPDSPFRRPDFYDSTTFEPNGTHCTLALVYKPSWLGDCFALDNKHYFTFEDSHCIQAREFLVTVRLTGNTGNVNSTWRFVITNLGADRGFEIRELQPTRWTRLKEALGRKAA